MDPIDSCEPRDTAILNTVLTFIYMQADRVEYFKVRYKAYRVEYFKVRYKAYRVYMLQNKSKYHSSIVSKGTNKQYSFLEEIKDKHTSIT